MWDSTLATYDAVMHSPLMNKTIAEHLGWQLSPKMPRINNQAKMTGALTEWTLGVPASRLFRLQRGSLRESMVRFSANALGDSLGRHRYPMAP